jgi:hypothetical protein
MLAGPAVFRGTVPPRHERAIEVHLAVAALAWLGLFKIVFKIIFVVVAALVRRRRCCCCCCCCCCCGSIDAGG